MVHWSDAAWLHSDHRFLCPFRSTFNLLHRSDYDNNRDRIRPNSSAFGVELDVADRAAVDAMVTQVAEKWGRVDILVANAGGGRGRPLDTKSTLDTGLLDLVLHMNLYGTIYCCNAVAPDYEAATLRQDCDGRLGRGPQSVGGWRLCSLRRSQGGDRALHTLSRPGSGAAWYHCKLHRPGYDRYRAYHADCHSGSSGANTDPAARVALRRLGTVEDCARVVEFLTTDLSDYVTGWLSPSMED
jgi:3-oxoacyl-[acyl-carrier protein] reductase